VVSTGHPFRLSLVGPVTHAEFDAAQRGVDPKTGEPLAQVGRRARAHSAGWDMTFSGTRNRSRCYGPSPRVVIGSSSNKPIDRRCRRQRRISKEPPGRL